MVYDGLHATETPLIINSLPFLKMALCLQIVQWITMIIPIPISEFGHPWFFEIESTNKMFIYVFVNEALRVE